MLLQLPKAPMVFSHWMCLVAGQQRRRGERRWPKSGGRVMRLPNASCICWEWNLWWKNEIYWIATYRLDFVGTTYSLPGGWCCAPAEQEGLAHSTVILFYILRDVFTVHLPPWNYTVTWQATDEYKKLAALNAKLARICKPKAHSGRLEVSQEIHKQWLAGGDQRKSLLNMLIKANGDKAGLVSKSILFSPCFDSECLSINDET